MAAIDAGMPRPEEITAESIRHTYIVYLVRQGIRLGELSQIVGTLSPSAQLSYSQYSPARPGRNIEDLNKIHPVLESIG